MTDGDPGGPALRYRRILQVLLVFLSVYKSVSDKPSPRMVELGLAG